MEPEQNDKPKIDLTGILLPKKDGRTSASAERVNAGVLLSQEQNATLPPTPPPVPVAPVAPGTPPAAEAKAVKSNSTIAPLQTYKTDIESVIQNTNVSIVSIAAAEAERAGHTGGMLDALQNTNWNKIKNTTLLVCGVILVVGASAGLLYAFLRPAPSIPQQISAQTPFIAVDDTQVLLVPQDRWDRDTVMGNLDSIKNKTAISLGLISRDYVAIATSTVDKNLIPPPVTVQEFLGVIAPNAPDELLRTLSPTQYLLGVHMYDGAQPFMIVKTDSYEQAFSGMLEWERTMQQELTPFFTREVHARPNAPALATSTTFLPGAFRDKVVANHDARVVLNSTGDILLLWTFLDRNTLVITTAETTLGEIISRRNTFVPGQ